jgi:flagellar biosynthesis/type III secretory pathway protein FliH
MSISGSELLDAKTDSSIDEIAGLLKASRNSKFDDDDGVLHVKEEFEKIGNFFDLVRSGEQENSDNSQTSDEVEHEYSTSESLSDMDEPSLLLDEEFIVSEDEHNEGSSPDGSDVLISENLEEFSSEEKNMFEDNMQEASEFISDPITAVDPEKFEDEDKSQNKVIDDALSSEFERGYSEAVLQLEKSLDHEKLSIQNLSKILFSIQNDVAELTSVMIKSKISDIAIEFLGEKIDEMPDKFLKKIHEAVGDISKYLNDITVELNELDALALQASENDAAALDIKFKTNPSLERGEFKITDGDTSYSKQHL